MPRSPPLPNLAEHARAGAVLTIDLKALADNWRLLSGLMPPGAACAAVVKADGYGLGARPVGRALRQAGCRTFFVASLDEGLGLRAVLPDAEILVLNGPYPGTAGEFAENSLIPVLNEPGQVEEWAALTARWQKPLPAALHLDTGMNRLGLTEAEARTLADDPKRTAALSLCVVMSHLCSAECPDDPLNALQLERFTALRRLFPQGHACFANSSGLFLGAPWRLDLGRPGVALYGVNPTPHKPNPMAQVVRLHGRIIQVRDVDTPQTVGYGATYRVPGKARIATVAVGYADGFLRSLSNRAQAAVGDVLVPLVGRVSMDLTTFDVTNAPPHLARPGGWIDLIGPHHDVDALASEAGTIGYEILTSLGRRYARVYSGAGAKNGSGAGADSGES